jgi:hypothetical protein
MYPIELKDYVNTLGSFKNKIGRSGSIIKPYQKFLDFCNSIDFKLNNLEAYSFYIRDI